MLPLARDEWESDEPGLPLLPRVLDGRTDDLDSLRDMAARD